MLFSVTSSSFGAGPGDGPVDLFALVARARELGFDGIEFGDLFQEGPEQRAVELAGRLGAACRQAGLSVVCYSVGGDFINPRGGDLQKELEHLKAQIRVAAAMRARLMGHCASRGLPSGLVGPADFLVALPTLARCCRSVAFYAQSLGVKTCVQNHGLFVQASDRCEALARQVGQPNFGWLVDVGSFLRVDEDPARAVRRLAGLAVHVRLADYHVRPARLGDPGEGFTRPRGDSYLRGAILGHGQIDLAACLSALKVAGYSGYVGLEFDGLEDRMLALRISLANLRRLLEAPPEPVLAGRGRGGAGQWLDTFDPQ